MDAGGVRLSHRASQRGHSDHVPAADEHADGQRRGAVDARADCGSSTRLRTGIRRTICNINNAARNLVEIIANAARADTGGDYPIRIYTIGMGELVRCPLGTRCRRCRKTSSSGSPTTRASPDKKPAPQLEGRYYFAETAEHVSAAFQALQNQIIRLTK